MPNGATKVPTRRNLGASGDSVPATADCGFPARQMVLSPKFGGRTAALNGKLAEKMPLIIEAALGGNAVYRQIRGHEQMAGVADT